MSTRRVSGELTRAMLMEPLEARLLLATDSWSPPRIGNTQALPLDTGSANLQLVYLDFDGQRHVPFDAPVRVADLDVPPFVAPSSLAGQEREIVHRTLEHLGRTAAGWPVTFTNRRPDSAPYSTIHVGGDDAAFRQYGSFWGLAQQVDVGNRDLTDRALVFSHRIGADGDTADTFARRLATVIAHEAGHLIGLAHDSHTKLAGDAGPLDQVAFKPYTHVEIGKDVLADVVPDGKVTIGGNDYSPDANIVQALTDWPEFYNAGAIGPDAFPDIVMGQGIIHPENTGDWLAHLLTKAWKAQTDPTYTSVEREQILAWTYGYLTHAAGDIWSHTLVNEFAGGPFPALSDVVTDTDDLANALRHVFVEGYIGDATPGFDGDPARGPAPNGDTSDDSTPGISLDAPHRFIYETFVKPDAGQPAANRGQLVDFFLQLRTKLEEEVGDPVEPADTDAQNASDELDDAEDAADRVEQYCNVLGVPINILDANCRQALVDLGADKFATLTQDVLNLSEDAVESALNKVYRAYLRAWIKDIDEGLKAWGELNLAVAKALFDPQTRRDVQNAKCQFHGPENTLSRANCENAVGPVDVVLDQIQPFINNHLLSMLGAPDFVGGLRAKLQSFGELLRQRITGPLRLAINPLLNSLAEIKEAAEDLVKDAIKEKFGFDVDAFSEFLDSPSSKLGLDKIGFGSFTINLFQAGDRTKLDGYLGIPLAGSHEPLGSIDMLPKFVFHGGAAGRLKDTVVFDKNQFAAYANSVTLSKLLLLNGAQLDSLLADLTGAAYDTALLNANAPNGGNIMTMTLPRVTDAKGQLVDSSQWVDSIDEDHAWRTDGQPQSTDARGIGNFPLWESCLLRGTGFRTLFTDWENGINNFPDLGDATSHDPNEQAPDVWYFNDPGFFGGLRTVFVSGTAAHTVTVQDVGTNLRVHWTASLPLYCAAQYELPLADVDQVIVRGVGSATDLTAKPFNHQTTPEPGQIAGLKWHDADANGNRTVISEPALKQWQITLDTVPDGSPLESFQPTRYTRPDGTYSFTGLPLGTYDVAEHVQDGWKKSHPTTDSHTVTLTAGTPTASAIDFGNFQPADDLNWIPALGAYLDELLVVRQNPLQILGFEGSLDSFIDIPFFAQQLADIVDFSKLFLDLDTRLYEDAEVLGTAALPGSFTLTDEARFIINPGGIAPTEVVIPTGTTQATVVAQFNSAMLVAGLAGQLVVDVAGGGELRLSTVSPGLMPSLTVATLRLTAANAGPANGQLDKTAGPLDPFTINVTRTVPDESGNPVATTESYDLKLLAEPPEDESDQTPHTEDNVTLQDLADDVNDALVAASLFDLMAVVDPGPDNQLDTSDDRLVLAATHPVVTKIAIGGTTGNRLGFNNNQSIDSTTNNNPAATVLKFPGGQDIAQRAYESIQEMLPLVEQAVKDMSSPPLPITYSLVPDYDLETNTVEFDLRLNHVFAKTVTLNLFDKGIDLDTFGILETAAIVDAQVTVPVQLDLRVGLHLNRRPGNFKLTETTRLSNLNGGAGVNLLVGLTAPNVIPVNGQPGQDVALTVQFVREDGQHEEELTLPEVATSGGIESSDNTDAASLVSDLNRLLSDAGLGRVLEFAVFTKVIEDISGQVLDIEEYLTLVAIDPDVRSVEISGDDIDLLGFATGQQASDYPDLSITLGTPLAGDDDCSDDVCSFTVNLDGAITVGDLIEKIQDKAGSGGDPAVEVAIDQPTSSLTLTAKNDLIVEAARAQKLTIDKAGTPDIKDALVSLAAVGLGIAGVAEAQSGTATLEGTSLDGFSVKDRVYLVERDPNSTDKNLRIGLGVSLQNLDVSAALGQLSFDLTGNANLEVTLATNLRDPGRSSETNDGRSYLGENFRYPPEVLVLNPTKMDIDYLATASLALTAGFDSTADDLVKKATGQTNPQITVDVIADSINRKFDFDIDVNFQDLLDQLRQLDVDDVLQLLRGLVGQLQQQNQVPFFQQNIPVLNRSLNDIVDFADAMIKAADRIVSDVDVPAVEDAVSKVETAVWDVVLPLEDRTRMLRAVDLLKQALATADEVDSNGNLRLPGRLLSAARALVKAIYVEVEQLTQSPAGETELIEARDELLALVPQLNTLEERLSQKIEEAIEEALNLPPTAFEFDLLIVDNYDTAGDRALVVGFTLLDDDLIDESFTPELPTGDSFGPLEFEVDPQFDLHGGGTISIGLAYDLNDKQALVLIDDPDNSLPTTVLQNLHTTQADLTLGFIGQVAGNASLVGVDLLEVNADLSLLRAQADTFLPVDFTDGEITLSASPFFGTDGRFIIVAVIDEDTSQFDVLHAGDHYTLQTSGPNTVVKITSSPQISLANAEHVVVEFHTADPLTKDAAVVTDRATAKIHFAPNTPITNNKLGAVPLGDLFTDASVRFDAQAKDNSGTPAHGSLLVGSASAEFLGNRVEDAIVAAASVQYLLDPQLYVDETALGELFEDIDFDLKTILIALEAFLEKLEEGLSSEVAAKLPVIGDNLDTAATFIGKLREDFVVPFREFLCNELGGSLDEARLKVRQFVFDKLGPTGVNILADRADETDSPDNIIDVDDVLVKLDRETFEIVFTIAGTDTLALDFKSGLSGLPVSAAGIGGVELSLGYDVDFGVGVDKQQGFYLVVNNDDNDPEFQLNLGAGLTVDTDGPQPVPTSLTIDLFGLKVSATDNNNGNNPGTFINGQLALDLADVGANDDRLPVSDILSTPFGEIFTASMSATVAVDLHLDAGINSTLPSVSVDMILDWIADVTTANGQIDVSASGLDFRFENLCLNLGDFLSKHIGKALNTINKYIEPIKPVITLLKQKVPGVSQLSEAAGRGEVTFLDLAFIQKPDKAEAAKKFVDTLDAIISLIDSFKSIDASDKVCFELLDQLVVVDSNQTGGNDGGLSNEDWNTTVDTAGLTANEPPPDTSQAKPGLRGLLQKIEDLGIGLHFLEPKNILNMILGRPFDVISYDLPRFELPFTWEVEFKVIPVPPINIRIGLDAEIFADISVGYDSHGLDTGNFFDGFYFGDLEGVFVGEDIDEFGLGLGVRLAALLDLLVASAGVEGELRADILANWRDVDENGKMYLDEIVSIVQQDGIQCLFDLRGELRAIVRLVWEVFGKEGSKEFINALLFSFQNKCPTFELGHVIEGTVNPVIDSGPHVLSEPGTLIVHAGPFASQRRKGTTSDVAEEVTITQLAPGIMKVEMLGLESRYSGVERIYFDGGQKNDKLILVNVDVPVTAFGGAGDDELAGTAHKDYLDGGSGNDLIVGRGNKDTLLGGEGGDRIYGDLGPGDSPGDWGSDGDDNVQGGGGDDEIVAGGGADTVDGGSGNDTIFGHGNGDLSITFGPDAADMLRGGTGNDVIYGADGADMIFGDGGHDQLFGQADNDVIDGGGGNDLILGDHGNDEIHGGSGRDIASGGIGLDVLFGDDGNDLLAGGLLTAHAEMKQLFKNAYGADDNFVTMIASLETPGADSSDTLWGGRDNDLLVGDAAGDKLLGGWGNDAIIAHLILDPTSTDSEYIEGGPDNDFICGTHGQDQIFGGTADFGLASILALPGGQNFGGGFAISSCDSTPVIIDVPPTAEVHGLKFNDRNADGKRDPGEPPLAGWTIDLLDDTGNVIDSQVTNAAGEFSFTGLDPGRYRVVEQLQSAWLQTTPGGLQLLDLATHPTSGQVYAISDQLLYLFDIATGDAQPIGPLGVTGLNALAFGANGTLYAMGPSDPRLYVINLSMGQATPLFNTTYTAAGGLVFRSTDSMLYFSTGSALVRVDVNNQQATLVGGHNHVPIIALKSNSGGKLYAVDSALDVLHIDPQTGAATALTGNPTLESLGVTSLPLDVITIASHTADPGFQFSLYAGQRAEGIEFGNRFQSAEIRGRKFHDLDGDGLHDSGEPWLNGWEIALLDELGETITTTLTADLDLDEDGIINPATEKGWYRFGDLDPGTYSVAELPKPSWVQTWPLLPSGDVYRPIADDGYSQTVSDLFVSAVPGTITDVNVTLNIQHEDVQHLRAFLVSPWGARVELFAGVGGDGDDFTNTVFDDSAALRIDDSSLSAPFTGSFRPVRLLPDLNGQSPNGIWSLIIEDEVEGTAGRLLDWSVTLTTTAAGPLTLQAETPNPHDPQRIRYYTVTLNPDEVRDDLDFGNYQVGSIDGLKFHDANGNSQRDPNERGIAGVTIYLDLNQNGQFDRGEPSTITRSDNPDTPNIDETGTYRLAPVPPGFYHVREVVPEGFEQTVPPSTGPTPASHGVEIMSGGAVEARDFGNRSTRGSIHGQKWLDRNGNGRRDPDEVGLDGWTVRLIDQDGRTAATTTTMTMDLDGDGRINPFSETGWYWFQDVLPGAYQVVEQPRANWQQTFPLSRQQGYEVRLKPRQRLDGLDFGNRPEGEPPGSIHGQKWLDRDGDGKRNPQEPGINGWTIQLFDPDGHFLASQVTMSMDLNGDGKIDPVRESGWYWFNELPPGRYVLVEDQKSGWVQTFPESVPQFQPGDSTFDFQFNSSDLIVVFQAGKYETGRRASFVEGDWNQDGLFDSADLVLVFQLGLYEQGHYATPDQNVYTLDLRPGQRIEGIDFGNQPIDTGSGSIHGVKWFDENGNRRRDSFEPRIAGMTIYADLNGSGVHDQHNGQLEPSAITMDDDPATPVDESGVYWLEVPAGTHVIREIIPHGFFATFPPGGVHTVTVAAGQQIDGVDFGNAPKPPGQNAVAAADVGDNHTDYRTASTTSHATGAGWTQQFRSPHAYDASDDGNLRIGPLAAQQQTTSLRGTKWHDRDGDGIRDPGEPPLAGVVIYLDLNNNGQLDGGAARIAEPSTVTDNQGNYQFTNVAAGNYIVREVPAGLIQTFPHHKLMTHSFRGVLADISVGIHPALVDPRPSGVGQLIGITRRSTDGLLYGLNEKGELFRIDPSNGAASLVGATGQPFPEGDLDFDPTTGILYAYRSFAPGLAIGDLFTINPDTAAATRIGSPSIASDISAIAFDDLGSLHALGLEFAIGAVQLYVINKATAQITSQVVLIQDDGQALAFGDPFYAGLDFEPGTGRLFAVSTGPQPATSLYYTIIPATGAVTPLATFAVPVVEHTLAGLEFVPFDGHVASLAEGDEVVGLDFGNQTDERIGSIHGLKWLDSIDPLGRHDEGEPGVPGVTIYLDLNGNGQLDPGEPSTVTMDDDPQTPENEAGHYWLMNVPPGEYIVREVVPPGMIQSSPRGLLAVSPLPFAGLTASPEDGRLYSVTTARELRVFQPNSTASTVIGTLEFELADGAIDFDPTSGVAYVVSSAGDQPLYRLQIRTDAQTGQPVLVSQTLVGNLTGAADPSGMAFDRTGRLYVLDLAAAGTRLLEVDKTTAAVLATTNVQTPLNTTLAGMDYDSLTHVFVVADAASAYSLNRAGQLQPIETTNLVRLAGLEILLDRHHVVTVGPGEQVVNVDFGNFEPIPLPDGDDVIYASEANDTVYGDNLVSDPRVLSVGSRQDTIFGQGGADKLFGQERSDQLSGGSDGSSPAHDWLDGGLGPDRVFQQVDNHQTLTDPQLVGEGTDSLVSIERGTLVGGPGNNILDAAAFTGPVILQGQGGDDTLLGGDFDDELDGGPGNDQLKGGLGDDTYQFTDVPPLAPAETDTIEEVASAGADTLDFSQLAVGVQVDLTSVVIAQHPGSPNGRTVQVAAAGQQANLEHIVGTPQDDTIIANAANNVVRALGGSDAVTAGDGNDLVDLGGGTGDSANGGPGDDRYVFRSGWGTATIIEAAGGGSDTLDFSLVEDPLTFTIGSLQVTDGTNTVSHAASAIEHLIGSEQDDRFVFQDGGSLPNGGSITADGGVDELDFSAYTTPITVDLANETATMSASTIDVFGVENIIGGSAADTLIGDAADNRISGGPGADTITGLNGRDLLRGGLGNDAIDGGPGDDVIHGDENDDTLAGGSGDDTYLFADGSGFDLLTEAVAGGNDTVDFSGSTLALTFNILAALVDVNVTSTSANVLDASNQIERWIGTAADDTFTFADAASVPGTLDGDAGTNTLDYSAYTTGLVVDLDDPAVIVAGGSATGTQGVNRFAHVLGGSGDDQLSGNAQDNHLFGGPGDDELHGDRGNDRLDGGPATTQDELFGEAGGDTYVIRPSSVLDVLHEVSGFVSGGLATSGGDDTIDLTQLTAAVTLDLSSSLVQNLTFAGPSVQLDGPQHFENVLGSLTAANMITGNDADNRLVGGATADVIDGAAGNDLLFGRAGSDTLQGGAGDDVVLGMDGNDNLFGDDMLNLLSGRDIVFGGANQDTVRGGQGQDIVSGDRVIYDNPANAQHVAALRQILLAWISDTTGYLNRIDQIMQGLGSDPNPLNRPRLVPADTVLADTALDTLFGQSDLDWFLAETGETTDHDPLSETRTAL